VKACWEHVGFSDRTCGNIVHDSIQTITTSRNFIQPMLKTINLMNSDCWDCDLLPICMGRCIDKRGTWRQKCHLLRRRTSEWLAMFACELAEEEIAVV